MKGRNVLIVLVSVAISMLLITMLLTLLISTSQITSPQNRCRNLDEVELAHFVERSGVRVLDVRNWEVQTVILYSDGSGYGYSVISVCNGEVVESKARWKASEAISFAWHKSAAPFLALVKEGDSKNEIKIVCDDYSKTIKLRGDGLIDGLIVPLPSGVNECRVDVC